MKHINICVRGEVQGVFFRATCADMAKSLKICGYARNEADGSVWIEAEGEQESLDQLVAWCAKGPDTAQVLHIELETGDIQDYQGFEIR